MANIKNIDAIAQEILNVCGGQTFLHIGSNSGQLVQILLINGVDAYGFDESLKDINIANGLMPGRFMQGKINKLPYADKSFDTVIILNYFDDINHQELTQAIKELKRVTRRSVYLRARTTHLKQDTMSGGTLNRNNWERLFFNEDFRKHPSYYLANNYSALSRENGESLILLECISQEASKYYPSEVLKKERNLHMDMTREAGERSDAHIARYQWASTFVRPGDTVLDAACGLGYGSYVLQCNTMAAKTIGIDHSKHAIDYANINFAKDVKNLTFLIGDLPKSLDDIADNSIDIAVSFETLEHVLNPEDLLKEFHRILTPAGRVIISVPNDWSDKTGKDPNPFHLHIYTLDKIRNQIKVLFDLESIHAQSATHYKECAGSKNWVPAKRELYQIDANIDEIVAPPSEWWLAVGMKSPLNTEKVKYHETQYKTFSRPEWNVTSFSRDYKNPWLVRGMVDIGRRQKNQVLLSEMAEEVIKTNHINSVDTGAALCVKGYQLLNAKQTTTIDILIKYAKQVDEYNSYKTKEPHVIRWMISLNFVIAKLWLQAGMQDKARNAFMKCVKINPLQFSPLIANRIVEAYLFLGKISLISGNETYARKAWKAGIIAAQNAVTADWNLSLGDLSDPVEFALPELSSILDYASNCAYALNHLNDFKDKPWWRLHLQRSVHAQFISHKIQYDTLMTEVSSLDTFVISLQKVIKKQKAQLNYLQNKQLAELTSTLSLKEKVIAEQATKINMLNMVMGTSLFRLLNILLNYPKWILKVLKIIYLITSFITPRALRNKLKLVTNWLHNRLSSPSCYVSAENFNNTLKSNGYSVKKPTPKQGAPQIVHVIANFMIGGSSRLVVDLIEYLGHDYEQCILTSFAPKPPAYIGLDIEEQRNTYDIIPFIKYLRLKQPDFIHVHYWGDSDELWYTQAIKAAELLNIPVIENINTPTMPYISDIVKRYVYVSNYVRNVFGQPDKKHLTIYPGSDFSHFTRADDETIPTECVGMVYRLEHDKLNEASIKPFILIAKKQPKTTILIVGGGKLLPFFKRIVKKSGVEAQFEFTGYVDYLSLPNYYRRMSLFIAPVWKESFGQVSLFAMNMRIPVIGYDIGAISEIVNSKKLLAPSGDANKLADIAIELLNNDKLRAKIGHENQQRAEKNFSMQAMIGAYADLYAEMTEK